MAVQSFKTRHRDPSSSALYKMPRAVLKMLIWCVGRILTARRLFGTPRLLNFAFLSKQQTIVIYIELI